MLKDPTAPANGVHKRELAYSKIGRPLDQVATSIIFEPKWLPVFEWLAP
jgi:hypothetical protein